MKRLFLTLLLTGCAVSGSYEYSKERIMEKRNAEVVLTYKGKINNTDYKVVNKINFDPAYPDKPPYYEASHEIWFW